jgi:hypothetical protein
MTDLIDIYRAKVVIERDGENGSEEISFKPQISRCHQLRLRFIGALGKPILAAKDRAKRLFEKA